MGLLDGAGRVLGGVFGGLYPDALLHKKVRRDDTPGGSAVVAYYGDPGLPRPIRAKAQRDRVTRAMREAEGYAEGDVAFIIMRHCDGIGLPEPLPGDRLTWPAPGGSLYSLEAPIELDAADSHWMARGRPVR